MRTLFLLLGLYTFVWAAYTRDNVQETVYDDETELTWQDNAIVASQTLEWTAAIDYCEDLVHGGYDDWRLPNFNALYLIGIRSSRMDATFVNVGGFQHLLLVVHYQCLQQW